MRMVKGIARDTLHFILEVSKSSHPKEFAGLLTSEKDVIANVMVLPGTLSSESSARMHLGMMPMSISTVGSVHSHPSENFRPSREDLKLFARKGNYHIIACYPYGEDDWACYDSHGVRQKLPVLDVEFDDQIEI